MALYREDAAMKLNVNDLAACQKLLDKEYKAVCVCGGCGCGCVCVAL